MIGKKASDVFLSGEEVQHMDDRTRSSEFLERQGLMEIAHYHGDGARKWLLISSGVPKRNAEDVIGSVGIHQDVTDRKMVEENLRESRDEARAAEKAEQGVPDPDEPRDRTPIDAIMGMADLLGDTPLDAEQDNLLSSIPGGSVLLKELLDDMLDLAKKLEAGQRVCRKEPVTSSSPLPSGCPPSSKPNSKRKASSSTFSMMPSSGPAGMDPSIPDPDSHQQSGQCGQVHRLRNHWPQPVSRGGQCQ